MADSTGHATAEDLDNLKSSIKEQNEDRKADALMKKAQRAHDWRVQVWAQSERRIKGFNAQLAVLGRDEFEPYEPDFSSEEMIEQYANMTLSR